MFNTINKLIEVITLLLTIITKNATTGEYELNLRVNILDPENNYILFVTAPAATTDPVV